MPSRDNLTESFRLLQLEGFLIHSCLTAGLTALRGAGPDDRTGQYYAAFFQLSIGLERLMKVIVVVDHMARHRLAPPAPETLKRVGHDLLTLFEAIRSDIDTHTDSGLLRSITRNSVEYALLEFLGDFAKRTRYYNLDALAASQLSKDPLAAYNAVFLRIVSDDLNRRQLQRVLRTSQALANATAGHVRVIGHNLDGQPMSLENAFLLPQLHDVAAPHVILRLYGVLRPLGETLGRVADMASSVNVQVLPSVAAVPDMRDFVRFLQYDDDTVKRKKRWP